MKSPLRTFSSCNTETLCSLNTDSPSSLLQPLLTTFLLSVLIISTTLDISHEWIRTLFVLSTYAFFNLSYAVHRYDTLPFVTSSITRIYRKRGKGEGELAANAHTAASWVGIYKEVEETLQIFRYHPLPQACALLC